MSDQEQVKSNELMIAARMIMSGRVAAELVGMEPADLLLLVTQGIKGRKMETEADRDADLAFRAAFRALNGVAEGEFYQALVDAKAYMSKGPAAYIPQPEDGEDNG